MNQAEHEESEQLALMPNVVRARAKAARMGAEQARSAATPIVPAPARPVARVLVDVPLAHLDRPFDYLVPMKLDDQVVAGSRVKVRFAGRDVNGFVLERVERSHHEGHLASLRRAVSAESVLSPAVAALSGAVAARYAGTRSDVLRLAVPARHATVEKQPSTAAPEERPGRPTPGSWSHYPGGSELIEHLTSGKPDRAVWSALPGEHWAHALAVAAAATYSSGGGVILCVPDHKDVTRVDAALTELLGGGHHVVLSADLGPTARYRSFLAIARGVVRIVVGTRAAAFAPVVNLALAVIWDDGNDLYAEPRAPYPHTREVLLLRAHNESCAVLIGGLARTVEAEHLVATDWARSLVARRETVRKRSPHMAITGATDFELARDPFARTTRLPKVAHDAIRIGLRSGPVLVQTPRHGYAMRLACDRCRTPVRCPACTGPLRVLARHAPPSCGWCGTEQLAWSCPECGGHGLRAPVRGDHRTAEEIGRSFPQVPVRTSSGDRTLATVGREPAIVVATPGAEPLADDGYAAIVLMDTSLMLARAGLRTAEESLRRWLGAATLGRPAAEGGQVVAVGDPADHVLQSLLRWDPGGFARREMAERRSAHLPPASRLAIISGAPDAVAAAVAMLELPPAVEVLGPVGVVSTGPPDHTDAPQHRIVLRAPYSLRNALSRSLVEMQGVRSAKKMAPVRVQVDPRELD